MRTALFEMRDEISIHAPHEGERRVTSRARKKEEKGFQSTLPTRGSDKALERHGVERLIFQSTLPTRGSDRVYIATA